MGAPEVVRWTAFWLVIAVIVARRALSMAVARVPAGRGQVGNVLTRVRTATPAVALLALIAEVVVIGLASHPGHG